MLFQRRIHKLLNFDYLSLILRVFFTFLILLVLVALFFWSNLFIFFVYFILCMFKFIIIFGLQEAFALFDCDRDGEITVQELGKVGDNDEGGNPHTETNLSYTESSLPDCHTVYEPLPSTANFL